MVRHRSTACLEENEAGLVVLLAAQPAEHAVDLDQPARLVLADCQSFGPARLFLSLQYPIGPQDTSPRG